MGCYRLSRGTVALAAFVFGGGVDSVVVHRSASGHRAREAPVALAEARGRPAPQGEFRVQGGAAVSAEVDPAVSATECVPNAQVGVGESAGRAGQAEGGLSSPVCLVQDA